jgi:hypothetical protein
MNQYHYYLDFPVKIEKPTVFEIDHSVAKHESLSVDLPEARPLIEFLAQFFPAVECKQLEYLYTPPNGGKILIHSDSDSRIGLDNMTKINITWGPEQGVVRWWECSTYNNMNLDPGTSEYGDTDKTHTIFVADEKDSTKVYEATTNKLSLLNTGVFHSTYNPGSEGRYTLCFILFYKDSDQMIEWNDAVEIFKEYLYN